MSLVILFAIDRTLKNNATTNLSFQQRRKNGIIDVVTLISPVVCRRSRNDALENTRQQVVQRARTQICSQLTAMRRLQAYLDTYKLDGWRSSNQEKLKPTAELAKKRADIFHRKLKVRRLFETLNYDQRKLEKYKCREDSDGEIECDDVVCCECGSGDCEEDPYENDVVFCDGYCDLAYHMKCVKPPLKPEDVPKGDEGWLCPTCDCRVDVIYYLNLDHDQKLEIETCTHLDVFKEEQELFDKGIIPGTARFHLHGENEEDVWPSDESEDEDFKQKNEKDDGKDDSDESLSGSAIPEASNDSETSSSSESSSSSSSSDSAVIIEGPRRRTKVDYVKLNGDLFGDAVLDGDEEEKKDIKQPIDRRAQIAALVALKKKNDDDDNNNNNNKKKIRNKKWNKNGVTTTSPPARSGTTRKRPLTTSRGNNGRRTKDKASMSTPTKKRRGKSSSHSSPFTSKAHETKKSRTLSPARRGGRKRSF